MEFEYPEGATPLDRDEAVALRLTHITTREEHETFDVDEIAARFHHRLVAIHPFPNGNGRHARMMADLLLGKKLGASRFSWGGEEIVQANDCRQEYIRALQAADIGDYSLLLIFVRS